MTKSYDVCMIFCDLCHSPVYYPVRSDNEILKFCIVTCDKCGTRYQYSGNDECGFNMVSVEKIPRNKIFGII